MYRAPPLRSQHGPWSDGAHRHILGDGGRAPFSLRAVGFDQISFANQVVQEVRS